MEELEAAEMLGINLDTTRAPKIQIRMLTEDKVPASSWSPDHQQKGSGLDAYSSALSAPNFGQGFLRSLS